MQHRFQESSNVFRHSATCATRNLEIFFWNESFCNSWHTGFRNLQVFFKSSATWVKSFRNLLVWIEISCNARNTGLENVYIFLKPSATCATHVLEILFEFICLATHATQVSRIFKCFQTFCNLCHQEFRNLFWNERFCNSWHTGFRNLQVFSNLQQLESRVSEIFLFELKSHATHATQV